MRRVLVLKEFETGTAETQDPSPDPASAGRHAEYFFRIRSFDRRIIWRMPVIENDGIERFLEKRVASATSGTVSAMCSIPFVCMGVLSFCDSVIQDSIVFVIV